MRSILEYLGRASEELGQLVGRMLHPLRRRIALRRLSRIGLPNHILFVCEGNICRSPYAALACIRSLAPELRRRIEVSSAGFVGADRSPPAEAVRVGAARGVELDQHRSLSLNPELVRSAPLIVVMDPRQARRLVSTFGARSEQVVALGDLDPLPVADRAIRDPLGAPREVFERSYDRIDRCIAELLHALFADSWADRARSVTYGSTTRQAAAE